MKKRNYIYYIMIVVGIIILIHACTIIINIGKGNETRVFQETETDSELELDSNTIFNYDKKKK